MSTLASVNSNPSRQNWVKVNKIDVMKFFLHIFHVYSFYCFPNLSKVSKCCIWVRRSTHNFGVVYYASCKNPTVAGFQNATLLQQATECTSLMRTSNRVHNRYPLVRHCSNHLLDTIRTLWIWNNKHTMIPVNSVLWAIPSNLASLICTNQIDYVHGHQYES